MHCDGLSRVKGLYLRVIPLTTKEHVLSGSERNFTSSARSSAFTPVMQMYWSSGSWDAKNSSTISSLPR